MESGETGAIAPPPPGPDWLWGLIRGIRRDGVPASDPRLKLLWDQLRSRQLLSRSEWLKLRLRHIWEKGLPCRDRPETSRRVKTLLREWGILPPVVIRSPVVVERPIIRRFARPPRQMRRLRPLRPVSVRPIGQVRPIARAGRR